MALAPSWAKGERGPRLVLASAAHASRICVRTRARAGRLLPLRLSRSLEPPSLAMALRVAADWPHVPLRLVGYSRKGAALILCGQYREAMRAYKQGLEIDPANAGLLTGACSALTIRSPTAWSRKGGDACPMVNACACRVCVFW